MSTIYTNVKNNVIKAQQSMQDHVNENIKLSKVSPGDYVYIQAEITGAGQKFKNKFTDAFVIKEIKRFA